MFAAWIVHPIRLKVRDCFKSHTHRIRIRRWSPRSLYVARASAKVGTSISCTGRLCGGINGLVLHHWLMIWSLLRGPRALVGVVVSEFWNVSIQSTWNCRFKGGDKNPIATPLWMEVRWHSLKLWLQSWNNQNYRMELNSKSASFNTGLIGFNVKLIK